jgi:Raf kinase inhibitor-like YbhB/YbcL family protein
MQLSSPAFTDNGTIPTQNTCKGKGLSPPLFISDVPSVARTLALVVHDPDAPAGDFTHWTIWNISATTTIIKEGHAPAGSTQGLNDFSKVGYGAPCPPSGTHRYVFELYALNAELTLKPGAHPYALPALFEKHEIAKAILIGTVSA